MPNRKDVNRDELTPAERHVWLTAFAVGVTSGDLTQALEAHLDADNAVRQLRRVEHHGRETPMMVSALYGGE